MTKVSFYLFENSVERQVESACRLSRKLLRQPVRIWWYCCQAERQQLLDEALWTFDPQSFIPHGIDQINSAVCISAHLPEHGSWLIFNFENHALEPQDTFEHIIEIVENQESTKIVGRNKFRQYRDWGIQPRTFKL